MANYLLECEIVGGVIDSSGTSKIRVYPRYVYQKFDLVGISAPFGIALNKDTKSPVGIGFDDPDFHYIELTVNFSMLNLAVMRNSVLVLELDANTKNVVGFKVSL